MKEIFVLLFHIATAMIGHTMHGSTFWAIIDFFVAPIVWLKWIIHQEVTMSIIKSSFSWFFD